MVGIAAIFKIIGYASTSLKFFDQVNTLTDQQFSDANSLLQDIHSLVTYAPDKTLVGRINAKYDRFNDFQSRWGTLDNDTLEAFAQEILEGDGSIDNAIRRFHSSVYASGGYFDTTAYNIFDKHKSGFLEQLSPNQDEDIKIEADLKAFYPTLVEVEMRATTLIYFGYYLERILSGDPNKYATEIEIAETNHKARLEKLKAKTDELEPKVTELSKRRLALQGIFLILTGKRTFG